MGKVNFGKTTFYSGRVGNVVAYTWRGRQCLRSLPTHYTDRRSSAQLQQRAMFKAVNSFTARARKVLKVGLKVASINAQMTEGNYFMRINKNCFAMPTRRQAPSQRNDSAAGETTTHHDGLSIDYESLVLAEGPVAPVAFTAPRLMDETTVRIDFEQNPLRRVVKPDDLVYLVAYCPELGDFDLSAPSYRRYKYLEMKLNPYWVDREVHMWGFVVDGAGRASFSQYLGNGIVGEMDDDVTAAATSHADGATELGRLADNSSISSSMSKSYNDNRRAALPSASQPENPSATSRVSDVGCDYG